MRFARPANAGWAAVITCAVAISVGAFGTQSATAAPAPTPAPRPAPITKPGGLGPTQAAAVLPATAPGTVHIVKDTSDAPSCSGYRSQTTPPTSIRVLLTATNTIVTVGFENYVENSLPNEWVPSWDGEALKAGAVADKSYAWFWVNHFGGYLNTNTPSTCFDVTDDTNFQVYRANSAQTRTNDAVQQTWSVIARDADTHEVRQTFYRSGLTATPSKDTCGAGANGTTMSQYGSQACAVAGKDFRTILNTYYFAKTSTIPALELATATLGPVSKPALGQVVLSDAGTLAAYRTVSGDVLGVQQPSAGASFGAWSRLNVGPKFVGQPVVIKASNGAIAVYARTSTRIMGDGQPSVGRAFTGWNVMGSGSPVIASDPAPIVRPDGTIAIYATASDGTLWGISQAAVGAPFSPWTQLSTATGFVGKPAVMATASGAVVLYVRNGGLILGAGQASPQSPFGTFSTIGTGTPPATGDPTVFQAGDGTVSVVVAGEPGVAGNPVWMAGQPAPGRTFGAWRQISEGNFVSTAAVYPSGSTTPVALYAADAAGVVSGAQAPTPASEFSPFAPIGTTSPGAASNISLVTAANGALGMYVIGSGATMWGAGQSVPGGVITGWTRIGTNP